MRKLGFIGQKRLHIAITTLPEVIREWRSQWCFEDSRSPLEIDIQSSSELGTPSGMTDLDWQHAQVGFERISLAGNWRSFILGVHAQDAPSDATARHLIEQAKIALVNAVLSSAIKEPVSVLNAAQHAPETGLLSSALWVLIRVGSTQIALHVDAGLLDFCLPSIEPATLTPRDSAIGKAKVRLSVQLPLLSLSIESVQGIKPGDILQGETALTEPAQLKAETAVVAQGYLARKQNHLAIQLIPSILNESRK